MSAILLEQAIRDMGPEITKHIYHENVHSCEKCGHQTIEYCFPVYGNSTGLMAAYLVYLVKPVGDGFRYLAIEFSPKFAPSDLAQILRSKLSELETKGTLASSKYEDMGRALPENRF